MKTQTHKNETNTLKMPEIKVEKTHEKKMDDSKKIEGKLTEAEHKEMSRKNPFGDFSSFEEKIDQMQPILPDENIQNLVSKIEESQKKAKEVFLTKNTISSKPVPTKNEQQYLQNIVGIADD